MDSQKSDGNGNGRTGARVVRPSCSFCNENTTFSSATLINESLSPGKDVNKTPTVVIIIVASIVASLVLIAICSFIILILRKMRNRTTESDTDSNLEEISDVEPLEYDFITIRNATNNFSEANKIGGGGFGVVYKGTLPDGLLVAVKKLSEKLRGGNLKFKNEVALMAKFQHRNLVRLLGFSLEGKEMLLVYEFVPNGGLDNILFDPVKRGCLDWGRCYKIIESIARGLIYLHKDSRLRIIHCNLKASKILLDADLNPKIADFDMSRFFALDKTHGSISKIMGTDRYMAPEYVLQGEITVKFDVYSFGLLVLEIISGQKIASFQNGESTKDLLSYTWTHWKAGSVSNVIDPMLRGASSPVHDITKCIHIALLCVQENDADRPTMADVLQMLSNLSMSLPIPLAPDFFIHGSSVSSEASSRFTKNEMSISDQYHRKMKKRKTKSYAKTVKETSSVEEIRVVESLKYDFITLQNATNNFSKANKVGEGHFGAVYKGKLENGLEVAVKWLSSRYRRKFFKNEVALLAKLQHRNLVRLLGFCLEKKEMFLVYEFVPNGGLDRFLFDPIKCGYLDWGRRYKIIEGIARGLLYLHEDSRLRIIHRSLIDQNVLLDADLNPKITDFGLPWLLASDETQCENFVVGTMGDMEAENVLQGEFSVGSEVYSFGVLVLEIISGQKSGNFENGESMKDLLSYAYTHWKNGSSLNVIDPMLRGISSPVNDIIKCIEVALLCVQVNVADRPTMGEVLQMLSNISMSLPVSSNPRFSQFRGFNQQMSITDDEYPR